MARYICTKPCWHGKRRWRLGEVAEFEDGEWPVHKDGTMAHFQPLESQRAGTGKRREEPSATPKGIEVKVNDKPVIK